MKFKKLVYYFLIALMISSLVMLMLIFIKEPTVKKEYRLSAIPEENIEISKNNSIYQYFQVQTDSINIIKIYIDSISNPNGNLKVTFYSSKGKELSSKEVELKQLVIPGINYIFIDNLKDVKNEIVQLKIEVVNSDSIVSIGTNKEYYENQYIKKDNKKINRSIIMYYEGNNKNVSLIVHFLLVFFVSLILYIFLKEEIIQERNDEIEKNKRK